MSWGGHEGQIIGLKKKEREAVASEREMERRLKSIIRTLERHRQDGVEQMPGLLAWAIDQLERALSDQEVRPFRRPRPTPAEGHQV